MGVVQLDNLLELLFKNSEQEIHLCHKIQILQGTLGRGANGEVVPVKNVKLTIREPTRPEPNVERQRPWSPWPCEWFTKAVKCPLPITDSWYVQWVQIQMDSGRQFRCPINAWMVLSSPSSDQHFRDR